MGNNSGQEKNASQNENHHRCDCPVDKDELGKFLSVYYRKHDF